MGYALPKELPSELFDLFPNARRLSNDSPSLGGGAKKATYEDKFMDSYQRGQAELERRRQIAREEVGLYEKKNHTYNLYSGRTIKS